MTTSPVAYYFSNPIYGCWDNNVFKKNTTIAFNFKVDEFLNISNKNIIYKVPDDKMIEELVNTFSSEGTNKSSKMNNFDELDDSIELLIISATAVLENLKSIRLFLLQQDEVNEQLKLVDSFKKFI
ncbi:11008_t:CDS:2, partial [Dentiscutata heterogama]